MNKQISISQLKVQGPGHWKSLVVDVFIDAGTNSRLCRILWLFPQERFNCVYLHKLFSTGNPLDLLLVWKSWTHTKNACVAQFSLGMYLRTVCADVVLDWEKLSWSQVSTLKMTYEKLVFNFFIIFFCGTPTKGSFKGMYWILFTGLNFAISHIFESVRGYIFLSPKLANSLRFNFHEAVL